MSLRALPQDKEGCLVVLDEGSDLVRPLPEQSVNDTRRAVPESHANHLGRCATHDAQPMEVFIFRDEYEIASRSMRPDHVVRCPSQPGTQYMIRVREQIGERKHKAAREILVNQEFDRDGTPRRRIRQRGGSAGRARAPRRMQGRPGYPHA